MVVNDSSVCCGSILGTRSFRRDVVVGGGLVVAVDWGIEDGLVGSCDDAKCVEAIW